jgi:hypothetical protein
VESGATDQITQSMPIPQIKAVYSTGATIAAGACLKATVM